MKTRTSNIFIEKLAARTAVSLLDVFAFANSFARAGYYYVA
jgi:hypothetical protein